MVGTDSTTCLADAIADTSSLLKGTAEDILVVFKRLHLGTTRNLGRISQLVRKTY